MIDPNSYFESADGPTEKEIEHHSRTYPCLQWGASTITTSTTTTFCITQRLGGHSQDGETMQCLAQYLCPIPSFTSESAILDAGYLLNCRR